jgi:type II secretory pathway pseudopilin PulG
MTDAGKPATGRGRGTGDEGSMLLELAIAIGVVAIVMASLTALFVDATATVRKQSDSQVAAQFAVAATERVSLLSGETLLLGRTRTAVLAQYRAPGVDAYLDPTRTQLTWQAAAAPAATVQGLPTAAETITVNGAPTKYQRHWYVGLCWQLRTGGECTVVPAVQQAARIPMYRIVVAVTWSSKDCSNARCAYVAAMLAERELTDPTF